MSCDEYRIIPKRLNGAREEISTGKAGVYFRHLMENVCSLCYSEASLLLPLKADDEIFEILSDMTRSFIESYSGMDDQRALHQLYLIILEKNNNDIELSLEIFNSLDMNKIGKRREGEIILRCLEQEILGNLEESEEYYCTQSDSELPSFMDQDYDRSHYEDDDLGDNIQYQLQDYANELVSAMRYS